MGKTIVEAKSIEKSFNGFKALKRISLEVEEGEIVGLLGPNGAGKSTLAKILIGALKKDSGKVKYFGEEVESVPASIRKVVSIAPQENAFYQNFTVKENIDFFSSLYGKGCSKNDTGTLLKWFNLEKFKNRKAMHLSGGYRRLLNIACSMVNDPKIIFLDEPTVGLDPKMRQLLWNKITALRVMGKTVLLTTHYMDEAQELCDKVALMSEGNLVANGTPESLIAEYGGERIIILQLSKEVQFDLIAEIKSIYPSSTIRVVHRHMLITTKQKGSFEAMSRIVGKINEKGYEVVGSSIKEPDLEDVFMQVTGKSMRD